MWAHPLLQDVAIPAPHLLCGLRERDGLAAEKDELTGLLGIAVELEDIEAVFTGRRLCEERVNRGVSEPPSKFFGTRQRQGVGASASAA